MSHTMLFRHRLPAQRSRTVKTRLQVEHLEDRTVPSITILEAEPNNTLATTNAAPLGLDPGEDTHLIVKGDISPLGDRDWFKVQLNAGDVIGALVNGQSGLDSAVRLVNAAGTLLIANDDGFAPYSLPSKSPVRLAPSDFRDANFNYVVNTPGTYFIEVAGSSDASAGKYAMDVVIARPGLESQPIGTKQILFVDFDGAKLNTSKFFGSGTVRLSPLARFLPNWGLTAADENAVIDAILATIRENLSQDVRRFGLNGDFAATHRPGDFDIEIRNSRDNVDDFGTNPFVSRLVIGGTRDEFGINADIVGIAEDIDPGNFKTDDEGVVFLDLLSGPASDPNSLNHIAIHPSHTKIELIGIVVGRVASHEAGHIFGNWHTDLFAGIPNIMDQGARLQSLGPDGVFGTHDDFDEDFGVDSFYTAEAFRGVEDTLNVVSFGLATGKGTGGGSGSQQATATLMVDLDGNGTFETPRDTSEFSACREIAGRRPPPPDADPPPPGGPGGGVALSTAGSPGTSAPDQQALLATWPADATWRSLPKTTGASQAQRLQSETALSLMKSRQVSVGTVDRLFASIGSHDDPLSVATWEDQAMVDFEVRLLGLDI